MQVMTAPTRTNGNAQKKSHNVPVFGVFKTDNYNLFKIIKDNRDMNENHIHRLVKSFEHKHLVCPIIVNEHHEVIDGQHRLEASKITGLPVYYMVIPGYSIDEVQILNSNQKNWTKHDFLNMFCERGMKPYLELREFMTMNPDFRISVAIKILSLGKGATQELNGVMMSTRSFENGKFIIPDLGKSYQIANRLKEFKPFFELYHTPHFVYAVRKLLTRKKYNHKEMLHKLESSSIKLRECGSTEEYLLLLEKIYNYKRADGNKVSLRYAK